MTRCGTIPSMQRGEDRTPNGRADRGVASRSSRRDPHGRATWLVLAAVALAAVLAAPGTIRGQAGPDMSDLTGAPAPRPSASSRPAPPAGTDLLGFGDAPDFHTFYSRGGWKSERDDPDGWALDRAADPILVMPSHGNSVEIGHQTGPFDLSATPILHLRFRIDQLPPGADLSHASKEDAAFRFFVLFDKKDGPLAPNTIGYAWATSNATGSFIREDRWYLHNVYFVVVGQGSGSTGQWVEVQRNVADDYRQAFHVSGAVPKMVGIGLKVDSNDTHTSAQSAIAWATIGAK